MLGVSKFALPQTLKPSLYSSPIFFFFFDQALLIEMNEEEVVSLKQCSQNVALLNNYIKFLFNI